RPRPPVRRGGKSLDASYLHSPRLMAKLVHQPLSFIPRAQQESIVDSPFPLQLNSSSRNKTKVWERKMTAARFKLVLATALLAIPILGSPSFGQDYPSRPVRVIVPFGAGGAGHGPGTPNRRLLPEGLWQ